MHETRVGAPGRLLPPPPKGWRLRKKTHASSPSTSGKTHEKTCPIQTRRETRESVSATPGSGTLDTSLFIESLTAGAVSFPPVSRGLGLALAFDVVPTPAFG